METIEIKAPKFKLGQSVTFKGLVVLFITVLLLIPTAMVQDLVTERQEYNQEVISSVSQSWGGPQRILGPFLTIPYLIRSEDQEGKVHYFQKELHLTPELLDISGEVSTEERQKSIYVVTLYNTQLKVKGQFLLPPAEKLLPNAHEVQFGKAYVTLSIGDQVGVKENIYLNWNGNKNEFSAGLPNRNIAESGFHTPVQLDSQQTKYEYSLDLNLNGYQNLSFVPVGKKTEVNLTSKWPDPGFYGNSIPDKRDVTDNGFIAQWKVFHLNRNIPAQWVGERDWDTESEFGVTLVQVVDEYQKNMRSAKYAFLIVCLTFLTFFLVEIIKKKPMHPFQYVMAGFALVIFYVLLLSITEHAGFNLAYLISSLMTGALIVAYISAVFKDKKFSVLFSIFFALIYGFIYLILQLEELSLLVGALGLFIALATTMMLTRKIDWYNRS